jgi:replicative DNA helicase
MEYESAGNIYSQLPNAKEGDPGIVTGIDIIDSNAGGLSRGIIILAGRPCTYYKVITQRIALATSTPGNMRVAWFTTEFNRRGLIERLLSQGCSKDTLFENENLVVFDAARLNIKTLRESIGYVSSSHGGELGLIVVDDLEGLVESSLQEGIGELQVISILEKIASENDCAIILNCGLSRKIERRKFKHPRLSDLDKYKNFVSAAEQILVTHRKSLYEMYDPSNESWELLLLKNRSGFTFSTIFATGLNELLMCDQIIKEATPPQME